MLRTLQLMQALVGALVVLVVVFVLVRRLLARTRGRTSPRTGNVLEVMDEVFSPARHTAALELRAQQEQGPVLPVPDDWLSPTSDRVVVNVRRTDASETDRPSELSED